MIISHISKVAMDGSNKPIQVKLIFCLKNVSLNIYKERL